MAKSKTATEQTAYKKHTGHSSHMCELVRARKMDEAAKLSKDAKFICHICGRAAASDKNLCEPVEI